MKIAFFAIVLIFLSLLLRITYPKFTFFLRLVQLANLSSKNIDSYQILLGKLYAQNIKLQPLVSTDLEKNQIFLRAFLEESVHKNETNDFPNNQGYPSLKPNILNTFPENLYLDYLNFYSHRNQSYEWQNFDSLFLELVKSPKMNSLSSTILTIALNESKISPPTLFNLIHYLNWKNNLELSTKLLNISHKENLLSPVQRDFLSQDILARKFSKDPKEKSKTPGKQITEVLRCFYDTPQGEIQMGQNLLHDGHFNQQNSLAQFWLFSDWANDELFSKGSYIGELDLEENQSMRIMGFFSESTHEKSPSRGGYQYNKHIKLKHNCYLIYFKYKTQTDNESPSIWLSYTLKTEFRFDPTGQKWKEAFLIIDNKQINSSEIKPLFRMWGTGTVWFDDLFISEIEIPSDRIEEYWIHIK